MFSLKKKTTAVVLASGLALSLGVATDLLLGQSHQVQADTHQLEEDNPLNISYNQYKTVEKWYTYQDSLIPLTFTNKGDKTLTITKTEFADSLEDWDSFFLVYQRKLKGKQ